MSNRELQVKSQISSLRGVNERMESTILQDDLVYSCKNIYFNIDGVASRIEGKALSGKIDDAVVHLFQFGDKVLVQTLATLQIVTVQEMIDRHFIYQVLPVNAPTVGTVSTSAVTLNMPALPLYADAIDLYQSSNDVTFTLIASNVTPVASYVVSGLADATLYYFLVKARNADTISVSSSVSATTASGTVPIDLLYLSNGDGNGVFNFYGTAFSNKTWANPYSSKRLPIAITGELGGSFGTREAWVDRVPSLWHSNAQANPWVSFDLGTGRTLQITRYVYRCRSDATTFRTWTWKLQASTDNSTWVDMHSVVNHTWGGTNDYATFTITTSNSYRYWRLMQTAANSSGGLNLNGGELELYGTLNLAASNVVALTHSSDGDANGLFYYLGTKKGTAAWSNPSSALSLARFFFTGTAISGPPAGFLVDRIPNSVPLDATNTWFAIAITGGFLNVTKYSIRARTATGSYPRTWKLQGCKSVVSETVANFNTATWVDIDSQVSNTALDTSDEWLTITVPPSSEKYRYFRFIVTGASSTVCFAVNEIELYGNFTIFQETFNTVELTYASSGDTNGLFYYLGTYHGNITWTEPVTAGRLVCVSQPGVGALFGYSNRTPDGMQTANVVNAFVGFALDGAILPKAYSIRSYSTGASLLPRNWKLQGSNNVTVNTVAGFEAASWTDLDTQTANSTLTTASQWLDLTVTGASTSYKYIRILQTGTNSSGTNVLAIGEIEIYGTYTH